MKEMINIDYYLIKADFIKGTLELAKTLTVTDSGNKYTHIVKLSFVSKLKQYVLLFMGEMVTISYNPKTQLIESIRLTD